MATLNRFDFPPGKIFVNKYEIVECLGSGWEGEVYKVIEVNSGVERAAKFFFPQRNLRNKVAARYAKKLHKLSHCPIVIQYHTQEVIWHRSEKITCLVSEYVDGEILSAFLNRQSGKRIGIFQGLHLLHSLASGLESMHRMQEYHGDLHTDNIIVKRYGLGFDLKLLDMHHWGDSRRANMADDICNSVRIFYDAIGGARHYAKHPPEVKQICLGLKRSLILRKFRTAGQLREYLENIDWKSSCRI